MASTPIQYPLINGVRHSGSSVELKLNGQVYVGFKSINYARKRNRTMVKGPHPDPIGKTQGSNEYTGDCELYLAEYNRLITDMGNGYGDVQFIVTVTYSLNGFDTIVDTLTGCSIDSTDSSNSTDSSDPTVRKFDLNPVKIKFNGLDDVATPLTGAP